jgi:hypothetical protein
VLLLLLLSLPPPPPLLLLLLACFITARLSRLSEQRAARCIAAP